MRHADAVQAAAIWRWRGPKQEAVYTEDIVRAYLEAISPETRNDMMGYPQPSARAVAARTLLTDFGE